MLALLGLFGVFAAGVAADAILSTRNTQDEDGDTDPADDEAPDFAAGNLLDDDPLSDLPQSDDFEDPQAGDLWVEGTETDEVLSGNSGNDVISSAGGDDLIDGRAGDDRIDAGSGADAVWAGEGDDTVLAGDDWLAGGDGDDTVAGGAGSDTLDGNAGNDRLSGLDGQADDFDQDYLNGGAGNDMLTPGSGDHAAGGAGEDDFVIHDWLTAGTVAHVSDYDASLDRLVIVYDPAVHPDPILSLEVKPDGSESTLLLDGAPVATVRGDIVDLSDIDLRAA